MTDEGWGPSGKFDGSLADAAPEEETDLWWGSYAGWAMLPSFLLCIAATAALLIAAYLLWSDYGQEPAVARHEFYAVAAALWLCQLVRWAYRVVGINYRLTTRRLFWGRGFLYPACTPVELKNVRAVEVLQSPLERWLGVGRVCVQAREPVLLTGVGEPERVAERIRQAVRRARAEGG